MIYQALPWLSVYLGQRTSPIVLVISPIMKNQVVPMKRKGINAAFIGEEQQDQQVIVQFMLVTYHLFMVVQRLYCQLAGGVCLFLLRERAPSGRDPRLRGKVILHVKQTIIIYKHNTQKNHNNYHVCYVYIIDHLHGSVSYNHEKVNFRLFNAYKRCKVTKVKDGNSGIN